MAGIRKGASAPLIMIGGLSLLVLAVLSGVFPVRLQRSDIGPFEITMAGIYILLSVMGAIAIAISLRQIFKTDI